ncbi:MAG: PKD domain-containing protein [Bacteroidia bacterium]
MNWIDFNSIFIAKKPTLLKFLASVFLCLFSQEIQAQCQSTPIPSNAVAICNPADNFGSALCNQSSIYSCIGETVCIELFFTGDVDSVRIDWGDGSACEWFNETVTNATHIYSIPISERDTCPFPSYQGLQGYQGNGTRAFLYQIDYFQECTMVNPIFNLDVAGKTYVRIGQAIDVIFVQYLPNALFSISPFYPCANETITIQNQPCPNEPNGNETFFWNFNGDSSSTEPNPFPINSANVGATSVNNFISCTVTNSCGSSNYTLNFCTSPELFADFNFSNTVCKPPLANYELDFAANPGYLITNQDEQCSNPEFLWEVRRLSPLSDLCNPPLPNGTLPLPIIDDEFAIDPIIQFVHPGIYEITLEITTPTTTCGDLTIIDTLTIIGNPIQPTIDLIGPGAGCSTPFQTEITITPGGTCFGTLDGNTILETPGLTIDAPDATIQENPGYNYILTYNTEDSFTITATNSNECGVSSNSNTININVIPEVVLQTTNDTTLCANQTVTLEIFPAPAANNGVNYAWTVLGNPAPIANSPEYTFIAQNSGAVPISTTYVIQALAQGCDASDTVEVTVNPAPDIPSINDTSICFGQDHIISVSNINPAVEYLWYDAIDATIPISSGTSLSLTNLEISQTWFVEAVDLSLMPCDTSVRDSARITVINFGNIQFSENSVSFCYPSSNPFPEDINTYLTVSPLGGVWSGSAELNMLSNGEFNPSATGNNFSAIYSVIELSSGCNITDSVQVVVTSPDSLSLNTPNPICLGDSLQLDPILIGWTVNGIPLDNGMYYSTFTGSEYAVLTQGGVGCEVTDSVEITINSLPIISIISESTSFCTNQGVLNLTGLSSIGNEFAWFIEGNAAVFSINDSISISPSSTTSYVLQVTDTANGCIISDTSLVEVVQSPSAAFLLGINFCLGDTIRPINNSTPSNLTYSWVLNQDYANTLNDDEPYYLPAVEGSYNLSLIVDDNICSDTASLDISIYAPPIVNTSVVNFNSCNPVDISFQSEIIDPDPADLNYSYLWDFGNGLISTLQMPNPVTYDLTANSQLDYTYSLSVSGTYCQAVISTGQLSFDSIPFIQLNTDTIFGCSPFFTEIPFSTLGTPNIITLTLEDGTIISNQDTVLEFTANGVTQTYLIGISALNSCGSSEDSIYIQVRPNPVTAFLISDIPLLGACEGDQLSISGVNSIGTLDSTLSYVWYLNGDLLFAGGGFLNLNDLNPGQYNVQLDVSDGCSTAQDSLSFEVFGQPEINLASISDTICVNQEIELLANVEEQFLISWSMGDGDFYYNNNSVSHTYDNPGEYVVVVEARDMSGLCFARDSIINLVWPNTEIEGFVDTSYACIETLVSFSSNTNNASNNINWDFGNGANSIFASDVTSYSEAGVYEAVVTAFNSITVDGFGCEASDTVIVNVLPNPESIFSLNNLAAAYCITNGEVVDIELNNQSNFGFAYRWYVDDVFFSDQVSPVFEAINLGPQTIKLVVYSQYGCADSSSVQVNVNLLPEMTLNVFPKEGCDPLLSDIEPVCVGCESIRIWDGGFIIGQETPFSHVFVGEGEHIVSQIGQSPEGCIDTISTLVLVKPNPIAEFWVSPLSIPATGGDLEFSSGIHPNTITSYRLFLNDSLIGGWLDGLQVQPLANNLDSIVFRLEMSLDGCLDTSYQSVDIFNDQTIYFPNTFTPNGDGVNDIFKPSGSNIIVKEFLIYNRWGELLHSETNRPIDDLTGWNGSNKLTSNSPFMTDMYVYKLRYESGIGKSDNQFITGSVYVVD